LKKLSVVLLVLTVIFLFASCAKKPEYIDYSKQNIQFAQSLTDAKAIVYADKSFGSKTNVETRSGENKALFKITTADDIKELNIYGKGYKWDVHSFLQISPREFFMGITQSESLPQTRFLYLSNPATIYTDVTNPASPIMYEFPNMNIIKAQRVDDAIYFIATNQGFLKFDIPSKQIITLIPYELYKARDFYFINEEYAVIFSGTYYNGGLYDWNDGKVSYYSINEQKIYTCDKKFILTLFKDNNILCNQTGNADNLVLWFDVLNKQFVSKYIFTALVMKNNYSKTLIRNDNNTLCFWNKDHNKMDEIKFEKLSDEPTSTVVRTVNLYYSERMLLYFNKLDLYVSAVENIVYKTDPNTNEKTQLYDLTEYSVSWDSSDNRYYTHYDDDYIYFSGYDNTTATKFRCNILTGQIEVTESNPVEPIIVIPFN